METNVETQAPLASRKDRSLLSVMGARYGLEPQKMLQSLRETYFKPSGNEPPLTNEEIAAALVVCHRYELDPFLREVHVTRSRGRLLTMVGLDGWLKVAKRETVDGKTVYDGMGKPEFTFSEDGELESCSVTVYRKDQSNPVTGICFMSEWKKDSPTWNAQPRHMLMVKAIKLALRLAFNISGFDLEEPEEVPFVASSRGPTVRTSKPLNLKPEEPQEASEKTAREPGED